MSSKRERAEAKFFEGYNCAQAVLVAFCDELGMNEREAALFGSSLGGGMGQLREVCGAVSAMFLIVGKVCGYSDPADKEAKKLHYENIRSLASAFAKQNGSYLCRELLTNAKANIAAIPHARTQEFYEKRPCMKYVGDAAEMAETFLAAQDGAAV